jgi:hypothetical protein
MTRNKNYAVANKFNKLDFHDDAFNSLRIYPPRSRHNFARVEFEFKDDSTKSIKVLTFNNCANFRFVSDFDVLADNWPAGNTKGSVANIDVKRMRKFVRSQLPQWRTTYMPPMPKNKPITKKLKSIPSYVLFRVAFFGGTAEILAKTYKIRL